MVNSGLIPVRTQRRPRVQLPSSKELLAFQAGVNLMHNINTEFALNPVIFDVNVRYGKKEKFFVPWSEASMHYGIAGGQIKAMGVKQYGEVCIAVKTDRAGFKTVCDIPRLILPDNLRQRLVSFNYLPRN